ncbi:Arc family DNA-binding protein [Oceanisphaera pacifica]|uniref:Arc family DNA-binding protein n=1 Tax=Oceanisphaera pacifica TaxID=2818389 RepID=A0ABS3NIM6_9GAMM|nr:Arc family DNA-binding protein [Oceanisphaera pacifica]MBO1520431.1 Arc family DNA-binding protein [Oceanisphaera pacifica]
MEQARMTLRLPIELHLWLKAEAAKNRRSLNSEIVARVEKLQQKEGK